MNLSFNNASTRVCLFLSGYLQAELIHWVDLVKIIHDKVEQGCSGSYRTIVFPGIIYLLFINFSFQNLRKEQV